MLAKQNCLNLSAIICLKVLIRLKDSILKFLDPDVSEPDYIAMAQEADMPLFS